jgi:cell division transport system permease protein
MLWTNTKRVIRAGFINFWRNGFVSLSSVLVMIITLFVIGSLLFMSVLLNSALIEIKDKVDINVYFVTGAKEEDVIAIKNSIEALPEVNEVNYFTPEQVITQFRERHENDGFNDALDELPDNPFGAMLNIKAKDPSQYAHIATFIESKSVSPKDGLPVIDSVNYRDRELIINRLTRMIDSGQQLGIILISILIIISVMITFNTIRLAIYISFEIYSRTIRYYRNYVWPLCGNYYFSYLFASYILLRQGNY